MPASSRPSRVALVADAHLGGYGGAADRLIAQLERLPEEGCGRLVLLGDIFHVWVGARQFETPEIRRVHRVLEELAAAGIRLDYVEGNRDFFLADSPYAEPFETISTEVAIESDGRRYLAVHGDGIDRSDRQYLFWRWLSKSALSRFLILHLPASIADWALHRTEASLARTNFEYRQQIPQEAIRRFAESELERGFDEILLGHYHAARTWRVDGGTVRILDAWFDSHRIEWLDQIGAGRGRGR
ncbi:MAG: UDP-2,3-diacylglucosamine diphosphatase [Thermoanaerobaculia bacterium]|nr:UDP-2,3-diacylglucosamine diphosphatase [Thermoanaerobaculia bacterium]